MRIIAGTHRGRRFAAPKGAHTRPTGDRVREALFDIVGPIDGASVLDLYAGSGALGLEALSRGAAACVFAETDSAACRVIRRNLETLGLAGGLVVQRDAAGLLRGEAAAGRRHDLVLADPPYDRWDSVAADLAALLPPVLAVFASHLTVLVVGTLTTVIMIGVATMEAIVRRRAQQAAKAH